MKVPSADCGGDGMVRFGLEINLYLKSIVQPYEGPVPQSRVPRGAVGVFGGEVEYKIQVVWKKHSRCQCCDRD